MEPFQQYLAEKFSEDGKCRCGSRVRLNCQHLLKDSHGAW